MPVLINPVLGTTTVLAPIREAEARSTLQPGQKQAVNMFTRRGVPLAVSLPLLNHFGWPEDLLGVGSFAAVFADPKHPKRVLKFSNDEVDGTTSSYLQMAQEGKVEVPKNYRELVSQCLPRVYNVGLIEFKQAHGEKDALWVINIERVMPIRNDDREESARVMQVITEKFEEHLRPRQREVLAIMESRRRQRRSYADLPHGIRRRMMDSLADFQQALSEQSADVGDEGDEVAANMLGDASMSVETLLALGAPVVDLHHGNFGFKLDEKGEPTTNLVVTDFGLSSLDDQQRQKAYAGATELRTKPKGEKKPKRVEDPRQMKLFENPALNAAFRKWFRDSKVVDSKGQPQVMYHGSPKRSISIFRSKHPVVVGWFAYEPAYAKDIAQEHFDTGVSGKVYVLPVYLRAERIFDLRSAKDVQKVGGRLEKAVRRYWKDYGEGYVLEPFVLLEKFAAKIQAAGFDSYYDYEAEGDDEPSGIAVFSPHQIKAADNSGTWSQTDPRIKKNPLIYKVSWRVGPRWSSNAFSSLREAQQFLERVKQWPGSSFHQVTNTKTGEVVVAATRTVANPDLSHKELVALTRCVLGGVEALRMKDYTVDVKTIRALIKKGYFVKGGVCPAGKKLVESLGTKAPLF